MHESLDKQQSAEKAKHLCRLILVAAYVAWTGLACMMPMNDLMKDNKWLTIGSSAVGWACTLILRFV